MQPGHDDTSAAMEQCVQAAATHLSAVQQASQQEQRREATEALARAMVALRKMCQLGDGRLDLRGRSTDYRQAISQIRHRAGNDEGPAVIPRQVNYIIDELLRRDPDIPSGLLAEYGLQGKSAKEKAQRAWSSTRSMQRAHKRAEDNVTNLADYIDQLTTLLMQLDLSPLDDTASDQREPVREALETLQARAAERHAEIDELY